MAVPRGLTSSWLSCTDGIGTLLDARLWVLRDWWSGLGIKDLGGPGSGNGLSRHARAEGGDAEGTDAARS
jgi:hypothetical protein